MTSSSKGYISANAGEVKWNYFPPVDKGAKVSLLTIGGLQVEGRWDGVWGQYYLAWAPLIKRDKERERALFAALAAGGSLDEVNARFDAAQQGADNAGS